MKKKEEKKKDKSGKVINEKPMKSISMEEIKKDPYLSELGKSIIYVD